MTGNQQKAKAAEPEAPARTGGPEAERAPERKVVTPPSYDPELFRRAMAAAAPPIIVSQHPASPEAVRLECLKIALGKGMSLRTGDAKQALREAVDDYHAIVADRPFPARRAGDAG